MTSRSSTKVRVRARGGHTYPVSPATASQVYSFGFARTGMSRALPATRSPLLVDVVDRFDCGSTRVRCEMLSARWNESRRGGCRDTAVIRGALLDCRTGPRRSLIPSVPGLDSFPVERSTRRVARTTTPAATGGVIARRVRSADLPELARRRAHRAVPAHPPWIIPSRLAAQSACSAGDPAISSVARCGVRSGCSPVPCLCLYP